MPAPLSNDIRKRIIAAKDQGDSHAKIAKEMRVSKSAITRLLALYRETGSYEPRPLNNGRKPRLNEQNITNDPGENRKTARYRAERVD